MVFGSTEVCSSFRKRTRFPLQFFSGACAGKKISTAIGARTREVLLPEKVWYEIKKILFNAVAKISRYRFEHSLGLRLKSNV